MTRVAGLGGGIGASRLWRALVEHVPASDITLVVNTADDLTVFGLRVCPDIDTTLYALSGRQDLTRGWGRVDETWTAMSELRGLGVDVWFNLGDRDLSTHLLRTELLSQRTSLTKVTARLTTSMGVDCTVLPMCDDPVETRVRLADGREVHYQEFLVRHHATPAVASVRYAGLDRVTAPAVGVLDAIAQADVVVVAPSNPLSSVEPVLSVPGVRAAVAAARDVVAVTPIVSGYPIHDPGEAGRARSRAALLASRGLPATATSVARLYRDICSRFVLDTADADEATAIRALGITVHTVDTLVHEGAPAEPLVSSILGAVTSTADPAA